MAKVKKAPFTVLYPIPAVLVSCGHEKPNIITLAWVGTVASTPPQVGISIRPERYSCGLVEETGEFVVNIPTAEQARLVDLCGNVSGRDTDKWAETGLTPGPGLKVKTPIIVQCPVNIECRVRHILNLGSHKLFIGEILAVQVNEEILDESGEIDFEKADPCVYLGGEYWRTGELLGTFGFSTRKLNRSE